MPCRGGGIGRRARLRGVWRNPYGFKSHPRHQVSIADGCQMRTIEMTCLNCSKSFTTEYKFRHQRKFCSIACGIKFRKPRLALTCAQCGTEFSRPPSDIRAKSKVYFCSRVCKIQAQRIGGIEAIQPEHYGKGLSYYRGMALRYYGARCGICGYEQDIRMLDVDHIDSVRSNNQLQNLQVLCVWCHALKTRMVETHGWNGTLEKNLAGD